MVEAGHDAVMGDERFREGQPRREIGLRQKRDARLIAAAERLIEPKQHGLGRLLGVEPPLETCARQIVELADALQARAAARGVVISGSSRKASTGRGASAGAISPWER